MIPLPIHERERKGKQNSKNRNRINHLLQNAPTLKRIMRVREGGTDQDKIWERKGNATEKLLCFRLTSSQGQECSHIGNIL